MFGIVIDAFKWYFMECSLDNKGKLLFKLLELVTVVYKEKICKLGWKRSSGILEEAQKPVEASQKWSKKGKVIEQHCRKIELEFRNRYNFNFLKRKSIRDPDKYVIKLFY